MMTASRPPKSRPQPQPRLARLMQLGTSRVLGITQGRDTTFYTLTDLDPGFGQAAFRLSKADRGDGPGEQYDVLIDGARSTCECMGFCRHGHCKHVEAVESLIAAGKLACKQRQQTASNGNGYTELDDL